MCTHWLFYELDFRSLFELLRTAHLLPVSCVSVFLCLPLCLNINISYPSNKSRLHVCCAGYLSSCHHYKDQLGIFFPSHEEKSTIPKSKFFSNYMSINSLKIFVKSAACIENGWK